MNTLELTPSEKKKCISGLKHLSARKRQQIRNIERKKNTLIEQLGEEEVNHRVYTRQRWVTKANELMSKLSVITETQGVS